MKPGSFKSGFTLIEMMLVIAVILLFVSLIVGVAKRIDDQGKERLTKNTMTLVGNAMEQFRDFGYEYKDASFAGLTFPLDCNDFPVSAAPGTPNLEQTLHDALYEAADETAVNVQILGGVNDPTFSGSEALYFILKQVPDCRTTLDKIDKSFLSNTGKDGNPVIISININGNITVLPFMRIIDPWKTPMRYDYYPDYNNFAGTWQQYLDYRNSAKRTFPLIISAGADKKFGTNDDISNIEQK